MAKKKSIEQIDVTSRRVLTRVDFNVPLEDGQVADDWRLHQSLPTINNIIERRGKAILMSHLGRPDGKPDPSLSLKPVHQRLAELLPGVSVHWGGDDCVGDDAKKAAEQLEDGQVLLLENLRFHPEEQKCDEGFAQQLASMADVYCNDAFGTAHRNDASTLGVPRIMTGKPKVVGLLMQQELRYFGEMLENPTRPFVAVLGGAKVSTKIGALHNLMNKVDTILIGGAMAYTILAALGHRVGRSLVERDMIKEAKKILDEAAASPTDLILPRDHTCGKEATRITPVRIFEENIDDEWMGLDLGPDTMAQFSKSLRDARTVVWNGPMGVAEINPFNMGTKQVARAIGRVTEAGGQTAVGGGDTAAAVREMGMEQQFSFISTGGGASLQMLEGRRFDTVDALDDA